MKSVFIIILRLTALNIVFSDKHILKQVVILSRHHIRTPLSKSLDSMTPKHWPQWKQKSGYLTEKGALLEGFMGKYFSEWLKREKLLPNHCPDEKEVFVYANVKQRTRESAKAFVKAAFPGCSVVVHHNASDQTDPIFNPVLHNSSAIFRQIVKEEMRERLRSLHLNESYEDIESILDYKNSELCVKEQRCNLLTDVNKIINIEQGSKPNIDGPLKIGNSVIDAFIMEYYEGFSINKVAWGELPDAGTWQTIMHLSRGYHNVIFNTTLVAKDISSPLVKYLSVIFLNNDIVPKITLLMGHDANMYTLLNGMGFNPYSLPGQYELTPVGSKIVFQRWVKEETGQDFLKLNYIYQTTSQMRNGTELSMETPPGIIPLELKGCSVDKSGFCPWSDFVKLIESYVNM